jgi:hypothetical protein
MNVRMTLRDERAQQPGRTADIAQCPEAGEIELLREREKVGGGEAAHRVHELLEPGGIAVERFEHRLLTVFEFVLRLSRFQSNIQIAPEPKQACTRHFEHAADVAGLILI